MPSLSERIARHDLESSAVSTTTFTYLGRGQYRCSVCGLVNVQPTTAGIPRCDGPHPTLRVDPASGEIVPWYQDGRTRADLRRERDSVDYRAPWRDNLRARDETGR